MKKKKRAVLYLRVRTADKKEQQTGWAEQEKILRRYCTKKGIAIAEIFRENYSAATFDRPEFKKLQRYLQNNPAAINLLLFRWWDRFSRNARESIVMQEQMEIMGVELQAVERNTELHKQLKQTICKKQSCMFG